MKRNLCLLLCLIPSAPLWAADDFAQLNALVEQAKQKQIQDEARLQLGVAGANLPANLSSLTAQAPAVAQAPEDARPTLRGQAFKQLLEKTYPLTAAQIEEMHRLQDEANQAVQTQVSPPPKPVSSTQTIDLSPGVLPPVVRLSPGFVSSIVFVDTTGQAWPVADYSIGNPKSFNIQWDKKTNTLFLQSMVPYVTGNLAVRLANLDTPVMVSLVTGQKEVDYRVDLQIKGRGPNAAEPIGGQELPDAVSTSLLGILDGVPPQGAQELEVSGGPGRAWLVNGKMIFRTTLTVLSPAWISTVSSPDGTHVYELAQTPLILASQNGKPIRIVLRGL